MPINTSQGLIPGIIDFFRQQSDEKKFKRLLQNEAIRRALIQGGLSGLPDLPEEAFTNRNLREALAFYSGLAGQEAATRGRRAQTNVTETLLPYQETAMGLSNLLNALMLGPRVESAQTAAATQGMALQRLREAAEAAKQNKTTLGGLDVLKLLAELESVRNANAAQRTTLNRLRQAEKYTKELGLTPGQLDVVKNLLDLGNTQNERLWRDRVAAAQTLALMNEVYGPGTPLGRLVQLEEQDVAGIPALVRSALRWVLEGVKPQERVDEFFNLWDKRAERMNPQEAAKRAAEAARKIWENSNPRPNRQKPQTNAPKNVPQASPPVLTPAPSPAPPMQFPPPTSSNQSSPERLGTRLTRFGNIPSTISTNDPTAGVAKYLENLGMPVTPGTTYIQVPPEVQRQVIKEVWKRLMGAQ